MDQVKAKLLADYKRSNKERKLKLAQKYGFSTAEEYKQYLEFGEPTTVTNEIKPTIHNVVLLDATGSMGGKKYENSKKGIQKELDWIKTQINVNYTVTVQEFIEKQHPDKVRVHNHGILSNPSDLKLFFCGANGSNTPLYKAVLDLIALVETKVNSSDKVLLKVYTDGDNNSLDQFRTECSKKIKEVQSKNFTVTFVGTKQDLKDIVKALNLEESNCLEIDNTGEGFEKAFETSLISTQTYSNKVLAGEDVSVGFYKKLI